LNIEKEQISLHVIGGIECGVDIYLDWVCGASSFVPFCLKICFNFVPGRMHEGGRGRRESIVVGKGDREIREGGRFILTISDKERAFDKERA